MPGGNHSTPETDEEPLKMMAAAIAGPLRDVDTPGVLTHRPPSLLAVLPDTDVGGTAHAANRVLEAVNSALAPAGRRAVLGIVCIQHGQRVRAGTVIEAAARSLKDGGRPAVPRRWAAGPWTRTRSATAGPRGSAPPTPPAPPHFPS